MIEHQLDKASHDLEILRHSLLEVFGKVADSLYQVSPPTADAMRQIQYTLQGGISPGNHYRFAFDLIARGEGVGSRAIKAKIRWDLLQQGQTEFTDADYPLLSFVPLTETGENWQPSADGQTHPWMTGDFGFLFKPEWHMLLVTLAANGKLQLPGTRIDSSYTKHERQVTYSLVEEEIDTHPVKRLVVDVTHPTHAFETKLNLDLTQVKTYSSPAMIDITSRIEQEQFSTSSAAHLSGGWLLNEVVFPLLECNGISPAYWATPVKVDWSVFTEFDDAFEATKVEVEKRDIELYWKGEPTQRVHPSWRYYRYKDTYGRDGRIDVTFTNPITDEKYYGRVLYNCMGHREANHDYTKSVKIWLPEDVALKVMSDRRHIKSNGIYDLSDLNWGHQRQAVDGLMAQKQMILDSIQSSKEYFLKKLEADDFLD